MYDITMQSWVIRYTYINTDINKLLKKEGKEDLCLTENFQVVHTSFPHYKEV